MDTTNGTAARYDLKELAARSGVTARTVHFYIQQGLLPPAGQPGPGTRYSEAHLARLILIRRLQREHLPLAEIRQRLSTLADEAVLKLVASTGKDERAAAACETSALDYIRGVLGERHTKPRPTVALQARTALGAATAASPPPLAPAPLMSERSQWERVVFAPDIELHIRRPLTRDQNKRVERLIMAAKKILEEEEI